MKSDFYIIGLFCAVCIGSPLLKSGFTARAGRVAQNVEEADRTARRDDFCPTFLRTCAQYESVEHVRLDHAVVYRGGGGVAAQCVGARLREGDVAYVDLHLTLAETVELVNLVLVFGDKAVVHFYGCPCQRAAREGAVYIIIIIVVLVRREFKGVEVADLEHRVTEGVGLCRTVVERHVCHIACQVLGCVVACAEIVAVVGIDLLEADFSFAAIDAVVEGVVADGVGQGVFVGHVGRRGVYQCKGVGEVEGLAHLALLEERGVAFGRCLYHLVLHGIEFGDVFARLLVGANDDAVALIVYGVAVSRVEVGELLVARAHLVVQLVFHNPRGVVAFELEHEA